MAQLVFLIEVKACEFLLLTDQERFSYRSVSTGWQGNPFLTQQPIHQPRKLCICNTS